MRIDPLKCRMTQIRQRLSVNRPCSSEMAIPLATQSGRGKSTARKALPAYGAPCPNLGSAPRYIDPGQRAFAGRGGMSRRGWNDMAGKRQIRESVTDHGCRYPLRATLGVARSCGFVLDGGVATVATLRPAQVGGGRPRRDTADMLRVRIASDRAVPGRQLRRRCRPVLFRRWRRLHHRRAPQGTAGRGYAGSLKPAPPTVAASWFKIRLRPPPANGHPCNGLNATGRKKRLPLSSP